MCFVKSQIQSMGNQMRKELFPAIVLAVMFICSVPMFAQSQGELSPEGPTVIAAVAPVFPPIARAARAKGEVVVEVKVNPHGEVEESKVVSGHPLLRKVSEVAAMKWKFAIAERQARSVRLIFSFGYVDNKSDPEYTIIFMPQYKVQMIWNPPAPGY
jgi:TonB family protein